LEDIEPRVSRESPTDRSHQHLTKSIDDRIVTIEKSSLRRPAGGASSERRSSQRSLSERHRVTAEVHSDSAESESEGGTSSEASDQEEQYQTCPSNVDQNQAFAKRRGVRTESQGVSGASSKLLPT
jgi:hypothetical protein